MPLGEEARPGSMGRALPGRRRWTSSTASSSPTPPPCRRSSSATSAATPRPAGPWHTGDRVRRDDDGYLYFEGRLDDVIISAGYRIGPFEVESALVAHSAVAEAAVVAAPDEERGSVVRAVVVLRDGYAPSEALAARAPGPRQGPDGAVQVPARRRLRRRAAQDSERKGEAARHSALDKPPRHHVQSLAMSVTTAAFPNVTTLTEREKARLRRSHAALGRVLRAGAPRHARRRAVLVPAQRPVADLHRARPRRPGLGRRRQRVPRLPQRLRRHVRRARQPHHRRRRQGADGRGHALRRAHRGLDRGRRGAASGAGASPTGASPTPAPSRRWTPSTSCAATPGAT